MREGELPIGYRSSLSSPGIINEESSKLSSKFKRTSANILLNKINHSNDNNNDKNNNQMDIIFQQLDQLEKENASLRKKIKNLIKLNIKMIIVVTNITTIHHKNNHFHCFPNGKIKNHQNNNYYHISYIMT